MKRLGLKRLALKAGVGGRGPGTAAGIAFALVSGSLAAGCVHTDLKLGADQSTTLEQQASGSYPTLARAIERSGVQPGPVVLTKAQLSGNESMATALALETDDASDGARVDRWLIQQCIGESLDGTLVTTKATCTGTFDPQVAAELIERTNRERRQVWSYLESISPGATPEAVREAWRRTRLVELVCGGLHEVSEGKWEIKKC